MLLSRLSPILFLHIALGLTAVPRIKIGPEQASNHLSPRYPPYRIYLLVSHKSHIHPSLNINSITNTRTIRFPVPNTLTTLIFSDRNPAALLPRNGAFLCLTEALSSITARIISVPGDAPVPDGFAAYYYGQVNIVTESTIPDHIRLTYGVVSNVLRGIGLFIAKYGFRTCDFAILQAP